MQPIQVKIIKETYKMDDGNLISGVRVVLAPMISKFIGLSGQKQDLLEEIRPNLNQWFKNVPDGTSLLLSQSTSDSGLKDIYSSNEL